MLQIFDIKMDAEDFSSPLFLFICLFLVVNILAI